MPNTINIVQPKAEDGVTEVSFVTRTNSIYKSDGTPLGDSMDAYMDEVDELSQEVAGLKPEVLYSTNRIDFGGAGTSTTSGTAIVMNSAVSSLVPSGATPLSVNIFRAVGANSYDDGTGYINTSGAVVFKPRVTQSNVTITYSISYKKS